MSLDSALGHRKGHLVPIVGRICMDQCSADITDYDEIAVGDSVTVISSKKDDDLSFARKRAFFMPYDILDKLKRI